MKLLFENWRQYLKKEEKELLEEGWKDWAMAGAIGLGTVLNPASAQAEKPKPVPSQTQKKPAQSINIKHFGAMEINDYYFMIGAFHAVNPDAENQEMMKMTYNFIHNREVPSAAAAKEIRQIIKNAKSKPVSYKRLIKEGKKLNVEEEIVTTTQRTEKSDGGGTERTTIIVYKWETK